MSCNHCSTKFNFFHKEVGCANCRLSFCTKCLKHKSKIPNKGPGEYNICKTCYQQLSAGSSTSVPGQPPDAYLKRLEALENPVTPITIYKDRSSLTNLKAGLTGTDLQLADRLEKLKSDGKGPPPSESEIRQRLNVLKFGNNYVEVPSKTILTKDSRTNEEKADGLLEQFLNERSIELATDPQEEIEARLATLREKGVRPNEGPFIKNLRDSPSSSDEDEAEALTKKIMAEVELDRRCPIKQSNDASEESDEGQQWCTICNEDADFECPECGDLYCARCHKELHQIENHRVVPLRNN